jgi:hypothetical protein
VGRRLAQIRDEAVNVEYRRADASGSLSRMEAEMFQNVSNHGGLGDES